MNGSIHKLSNELKCAGDQNFNDFNFNRFKGQLNTLKTFFNLALNNTIIENLEIGLNIETIENTGTILNDNLIVWNLKNRQK
ncbi:MAG: hypothetical protein IPO37_19125 [Saprospiraceae bacterium]|nr:hypothetical protein [Saprospiraceae bacterium]